LLIRRVPYCIHRGGFHADDAAFCPFCGTPIGPPATPAPPEGISAVFGRMLVVFSIGFNIVQSVGQQFLRAGAAAAVIGIILYVVARGPVDGRAPVRSGRKHAVPE
jgi:hypothetical protein